MGFRQIRKVMAILLVGLFFLQLIPVKTASAAVDQTAYYAEIGNKLEYWANKYNIPPVLLKAIAWMESGWKQYQLDATGQPMLDHPLIGKDGIGIGIMQISSYNSADTATMDKLKNDIDFNIETGCQMLNQKWRAAPKIGNGDRNVLENWYFAVWAYNSWGSRNNPNVSTGTPAYQDSIFSLMGQKYNSAVTFAPGADKFPAALLPPVNPPSYSSRWSTPAVTHTGDLTADQTLLLSTGGGPGADAANGDYWYNYARWASYYALGFYNTAYDSAAITDKSLISQKILSAQNNLLAEADSLVQEGKDSSDASAAKYYWTVLQGLSLDGGLAAKAQSGLQNALSKLLDEADKLVLAGTASSYVSAIQDYCIVLQGSSLDDTLAQRAKSGLLGAYTKLLAEADKLALDGSATSQTTAAGYYLTVLQGPSLDAGITSRAQAGYQATNSSDSGSTTNPPSDPTPTPSPTPAPDPTPTPTPQPVVPTVSRLCGTLAEDTAIKISQEGWADNSAPVVLLARVDRFQDALASAPLARKLKAPLLLTTPDQLDDSVLQELKRLGAKTKVYVIGGEGAVNVAVTDALTQANFPNERIFGTTAADTAVEIARKIGPSSQVILASSTSFPDALSASAPAAALGIPILLTEQGTLPGSTLQLLKDFNVTKTIIVGGKFAISPVFDSKGGPLASFGPLRLAGETKYDTMLEIVNYFQQDPTTLVIATGENFPDGLAGGAFAALTGSPMLLIPQGTINSATKAYLQSQAGKTEKVYILGGTGVIPSSNEKTIKSVLTQ
ncbi:cell wall-binding repeat-containing protein [Desulfosporosinus sp. PR]|uniref:cell wall-binding repeat-containing protein n=1 Tax=Candidatus Desulfosporosinus nitrosoreducens TaxID=3401928 RepID=UPI0027F2D2A4|nr:cell wall-binding repeat-containing protein [Desulfosporosinus sp. PR]MDQ7095566.1 cell wall-binding repeat-containing protein [Desulfosporosinus sp. PR]